MELLLHQLKDNLSQAVELYEDLLEVAKVKQQAIICADLDGLEQAIEAERRLVNAASRLENTRQRIHAAIARQMGIAPADLKLERLYKSWPFHDTSGLEAAHARLKDILRDLKQVADANAYIADVSLKLLKDIRRAVFQTSNEEPIYQPTGVVNSTPQEVAIVDVAG